MTKAKTKCSDGAHQYMVTHWKFDATKQQAVELTCQRCLLIVDKQGIEYARRDSNEETAKNL